ncbi:alpha/beta hydrolase [Chitinophaga arvensicola]|uniref:Proline iminopeptidase n=1 Tax=Chitinophaga arvensicola TaxID=29529 RepID=A0A1I0SDT9_9BACT|nr:alpha/beta hydrolase [Chitinophaga arvensicola]SEW56344.1 alpha/beta hydrolase fold [Chitinophaga arvensicola]
MKPAIIALLVLLLIPGSAFAQQPSPHIEPCPCMMKVDPALLSQCGYLVVPENRQHPSTRSIKVPFVYVRKPGADSSKHVTLFTTGGPGYSTIANIDSIGKNSGFLAYGGFIAFDQRGTKKSVPCLDCPEVLAADIRAYKENLSKDSLEAIAATQCRKRLVAQGIDLSAYNTIESAADINDLRKLLHIDSLNLLGVSYSGGLMLTVARNHPEAVRLMILNSPLPGYVRYEEEGLLNMNEALNQVFDNCEKDSSDQTLYGGLRQRFHQYFTAITGKSFTISYQGRNIRYTKNELLDALFNHFNATQLKTVPMVMNDMINGQHTAYVKEILDNVFEDNQPLSHGMRYSVYCSEQIAYAGEAVVKKQAELVPWLAHYDFNNVNHTLCRCWNVTAEPAVVKTPVYSNVPTLIAAGDADPWCRPFYNQFIKRYIPNSQLLVVHNKGHVPGLKVDGVDFISLFMEDPYKKIISPVKDVLVE